MKITKVETFLVRWGDVSRPANSVLASHSATAVVAIHADGMVGLRRGLAHAGRRRFALRSSRARWRRP